MSPSKEEGGQESSSIFKLLALALPSSSSPPTSTPSPFSCFPLLVPSGHKSGSYGKLPDLADQGRGSRRDAAERIARKLRSQRELDDMVDDLLDRLQYHYTATGIPSRPSDIPRLLLPSRSPAFVTAGLSWLGDTWRPSAILSLAKTTAAASTGTPFTPDQSVALNNSIHRFRIDEAVLDEEMVEYQTLAVLNLRAAAAAAARRREKLEIVCEEIRKVGRAVKRAQGMRYRAVEAAVGRVPSAAEFLVALSGIEEALQRQAARWQTRAGPPIVEVQALD